MFLNKLLQLFVPKDKIFFPLFSKLVDKLEELANMLHETVNLSKNERLANFNKIDSIAESIENLSHTINLELSKNFITPFDREDIHSLVTSIDDVSKNLQGASSRIRLYHVEKLTKSIRKLTEINLEACVLIKHSVNDIRDPKNFSKIKNSIKQINKLESKSDSVFDKAVAEIFENEQDAINVIKYKEVLSTLETATDKCKNVSRILESIVVKHS